MYRVRTVDGEIVVFTEKTSTLLTILMILVLILFIGELALIPSYITLGSGNDWYYIGYLVLQSLTTLIYVFVLNHLRVKGDMDKNSAVLETVDGRRIVVVKKSSIWITLGQVFADVFLVLSIIVLGAGIVLSLCAAYMEPVGPGLAILGGLLSLLWGIIFKVLGFLKTKIDFPGEKALVKTINGSMIMLYKSRSIWITIAMILTLITALALISIGVGLILGIIASTISPIFENYYTPTHQYTLITGLTLLGIGLLELIIVAILNFLRTRGRVKPVPATPENQLMYKGIIEESEIL